MVVSNISYASSIIRAINAKCY